MSTTDEMILVPRAELLAWAKAWLDDYGCPNDGTDCVTPFDTYLMKAPVAPVGVAEAWEQGYHQGVQDERTSEAHIGIAGFGAKVNPARTNPYIAQQPAPTLPDVDDDDLTVAYMAGRYDGRKEAQQAASLERAERMEEALRIIAAPPRPDGTWNRGREACRQIAEEALAAQLERFIEKHGEPVPLITRMERAEARAEQLAEALREVTATAITVLYATHRKDTLTEFSTAELEQVVDASKKLWAQRVEHIYRRAWDAVLRDHDQEAGNG